MNVQLDDPTVDGVRVRELPKVSLHDHLDGGVRPATVFELSRELGTELPAPDADSLADWFATASNAGSLVEYLKTFDVVNAVMQTPEALRRIAREFVEDLVADGVVYAEVRWAPELHLAAGMTLAETVEAVRAGFEDGEAAAGRPIRVGQLIAGLRNTDRSLEIAELAAEYLGRGVVGFDLAGAEDGFPASEHRAAFDYLAEHLVPVTVHAGEAAGIDSIRSALYDGRALRLGHGVRLAEDIAGGLDADDPQLGELGRWVRDRGIPLELSPSSNLQTGAIEAWGESIARHPFDLLYRLGLTVTVNVDNRTMSRTSLTREIGILAESFGYGLAEIEGFQLNAAAGAFISADDRGLLSQKISAGFAALR